jgi:hypothetical protein
MNPRNAIAIAAVAVLLLVALRAHAQEVNLANLDAESANHVHVRTGAEYGLVAGAGYSRAVPLADRTVLFGADLTMPWAVMDASDWRLRLSALVPIAGAGRWKLATSIAPTLRATSNDAGRLTGAGMDVGALAGYYAPRWFAAGELGFDWEIATYVEHSDLYRRTVFAGARDGWYGAPGGNLRLGLQAGLSFSRFDLVLRAGRLRDIRGQGPALPLYATLAVDTRF